MVAILGLTERMSPALLTEDFPPMKHLWSQLIPATRSMFTYASGAPPLRHKYLEVKGPSRSFGP